MLNAYAILIVNRKQCVLMSSMQKKTSVENKTKRKSFLLRSFFHLLLTSGLKAKTRDL